MRGFVRAWCARCDVRACALAGRRPRWRRWKRRPCAPSRSRRQQRRGDSEEGTQMTIDGHGTSRTMVALGGEGIGPEVIDVTCEVMVKGGVPVEILTKRLCESADGVLLGAAG